MANNIAGINTFWLVLNYICNNRCFGCYAQGSNFTDQSMKFDYAFNIIKMMKEIGAKDCLFIGGEPTLYPDLKELIFLGKETGIEFKLVTNGRKLADFHYLKALIDVGLKHASISIEGANSETHNRITRTKSFDEVMKGIENGLSLGLSFNTLLTINKSNFNELVQLAEMLHNEGVKNILYNIGLPSSDSGENIDEFVLSPNDAAKVIENTYLDLKTKGIKVKFFGTIPLCLFDQDLLEEMISTDHISNGVHCHIFYGTGVVFEPNGNVLPCTHFVGHPLFNLKDEDISDSEKFLEIWKGSKGIHGTFRSAIWQYPSEKCKNCTYWGKCIGGCPFLWSYFNPDEIIGKKGGNK